jgi:hypothetical protein
MSKIDLVAIPFSNESLIFKNLQIYHVLTGWLPAGPGELITDVLPLFNLQ